MLYVIEPGAELLELYSLACVKASAELHIIKEETVALELIVSQIAH